MTPAHRQKTIEMAQQLGFDLASRPALGRGDFFVSPANALALALIEGWADWPDRKLVLTGPKGAGKTHLTHVWAEISGARIIAASDLAEADVPTLAQGPVAVEDAQSLAGQDAGQTALFHLHNLMRAEGKPLLITGTGDVAAWGLTLPDLISRLQAATAAKLDGPDDTLLAAILIKLLSDRQLTPGVNLVPYLVKRMDRSFAAALDVVEQLDAQSLATGKPITRALAARVLDKGATET